MFVSGDIESVSGMNLILLTCLALAKLKAPANIQEQILALLTFF